MDQLRERRTLHPPFFRVMTAFWTQGSEPTSVYFLTNRFDRDPLDVATIYRYRWQIDCVFTWLKSSLKIVHFSATPKMGGLPATLCDLHLPSAVPALLSHTTTGWTAWA